MRLSEERLESIEIRNRELTGAVSGNIERANREIVELAFSFTSIRRPHGERPTDRGYQVAQTPPAESGFFGVEFSKRDVVRVLFAGRFQQLRSRRDCRD